MNVIFYAPPAVIADVIADVVVVEAVVAGVVVDDVDIVNALVDSKS